MGLLGQCVCWVWLMGGLVAGNSPVPAVPSCPSDFEMIGAECVRRQLVSPEVTCEKKSDLMNGQCVVNDLFSAEMVCPGGSGAKGKGCVETEMVPPEVRCESGFFGEFGGDCMGQRVSEVELKCPKGASLVGRDCVWEEKISVEYVCPPGFEQGKHGDCVAYREAPLVPVCPAGYDTSGGECVRAMATEPRVSCPKGWVRSAGPAGEHCLKESKTEVEKICPPGAVLSHKGKCLIDDYVEPTVKCPKHGERVGGHCVTRETTAPELGCGHEKGFSLIDGQCVREILVEAEIGCPGDMIFQKKKGICERLETVEPGLICPQGWDSRDGECFAREVAPLKARCPKGFQPEPNGTCRRVDVVKATHGCEFGEAKGGECAIHHTEDPTTICESGQLTADGICENIEVADIEYTCPRGATLDENGRCIATRSTSPTRQCPPGAVQTKKGECIVQTPVPPSIRCPKHYELDPTGTRCVTLDARPHILTCPHGFHLDKHENCVKFKPPTLAVPTKAPKV